jgi:hydroxyethylthiazole kinase
MEQTANALLSLGASPVMAHALEEVEEMAKLADSLVLNLGTLSPSWIEAMKLALIVATDKKIPITLDPVGAGATSYRTETTLSLLSQGTIALICGNASEIAALAGSHGETKGVDTRLDASKCIGQAKNLASKCRCLVWMSGKTDVITEGKSALSCNG